MSPLLSVKSDASFGIDDFTTFQNCYASWKKYAFCMPQFRHNFVSEPLEPETIISASTTIGFLKVQISFYDQLDDLLL